MLMKRKRMKLRHNFNLQKSSCRAREYCVDMVVVANLVRSDYMGCFRGMSQIDKKNI